MLTFNNVTFQYPNAQAPVLDGVSFAVEQGSFTAVIGASGSGKSTILRLLNGLERPQEGTIELDGRDIYTMQDYASYMPQQDLLFPWLSILENVMLPMTVRKMPKAERRKAGMQALKQAGLEEWADRKPSELSGGMRQRAAFARTLCAGTDLLLLDEPFSALDAITRLEMQEWLRSQWQQLGKTILFITHDVEEAMFLSQKILVLQGSPVKNIETCVVPETDREGLKQQLIDHLRKDAHE